MPNAWRQIVLLLATLALSGCSTPLPQGRSPLMPVQMSPDSVVLDMFFVRFPFGETTANEKLWEEIDEQQISPELRERLAKNGFRAGLIVGQMPAELSKLLELSTKEEVAGDSQEALRVDEIEAQPRVTRRHLQLRAGQRSEILASGVYEQLPLLMSESGQICGETYSQAQGLFAAKSSPQPDGRVRLELSPELHHDKPRQGWVANQGILRLDTSRPKREFSDLTISADLSSGAMLVLSSLPNRPGSLGHYFFTENAGRLEQKLLVIRLSQTQQDGLFNPPQPLSLEE